MSSGYAQMSVMYGNRPDLTALLRKLDNRTHKDPDHTASDSLALIRRYGGTNRFITQDDRITHDAGGNTHAHVVTAWAHAIQTNGVTLDDIYHGHVTVPDEICELARTTEFDPAAIIMLGVPTENIMGWERTKIKRAPHIIKNVVVDLRPSGQPAITPDQYIEMSDEIGHHLIQDRSGADGYPVRRVAPNLIRSWYSKVRDLHALGYDPDDILHLAGWVVDNWSAEAMVRFNQNRITPSGALHMENIGITRSDLIVAVVKGDMPLEWAIEASRHKPFI